MAVLGDLADRLLELRDGVFAASSAHRAWPFQCGAALRAALDREVECESGALVERFAGGALVFIEMPAPRELVVALVSGSGVLAAVACEDWAEAASLYAGLAAALGVFGGQCPCGTAVASVYDVCGECR